MQWTLTCILLASTTLISASDHGFRQKRDLSFLKSYLFSKIFGSHTTTNESTPVPAKQKNYRLFRIPGHDNILVKAVPKVPVILETDGPAHSVLEVTDSEPLPLDPSIAIVSKYLGTDKLNDTLFALQGVKNLLQSGVLTAKRESSNIVLDESRRPIMIKPSLGDTIIQGYNPVQAFSYPNLSVPSQYSYKQVSNAGVMSYTAHDNQNVKVTECKRPVPLPQPISYRIKDIVLTYSLPTSPVMHMSVKKHPSIVPVFHVPEVKVPYQTGEVKPYNPSGYSYNQVHSDGSMTTYSGSGHVEEHGGDADIIKGRKPISVVVAEMESHPAPIPVFNFQQDQLPFGPLRVPSYSSGYSYNHVHSDGSVPTYSGLEHEPKHGEGKPVVITKPGRPTVVVGDVKGPPAPFVIPEPPNVKVTGSRYSYNHIHNGGTVTTYSGEKNVLDHAGRKPAVVITEPGRPTVVVSDVKGPPAAPAPFPVFNGPKETLYSAPGYTYNYLHNDGTFTPYSGSSHVLERIEGKPATIITELGRPTVVVSDVEGPPAPFPIFNSPKVTIPSAPEYTYNYVHNDGTVTTYSGSGHNRDHDKEKPITVITEPGRPTVVVSDVEGPPAPIPVLNEAMFNVPSKSKYSYNQVHKNGTITAYTGSDHIGKHKEEKTALIITEPGRPTIVASDVKGPPPPFPVLSSQKVPVSSAPEYSYNHIHNDGGVTSYAGSGHISEHEEEQIAMVITEPGRPTVVVSDVKGPATVFPFYDAPKVKVSSAPGYSYNHVHNDGTLTTYSGSGHNRDQVKGKLATVITETGIPTVIVSDIEGPPAPTPVLNEAMFDVPSKSGYSYSQVHTNGTITAYKGSDHIRKHKEEKAALIITEPGRPTIVASDVNGPPPPFPVLSSQKVPVSSAPGYSYNHIHNDGGVTSYAGLGHISEHEEEKNAMVITEPRRPTVVVSDVGGPPAPFPFYDAPKVKVSSAPRYSYNHVHNDGTLTTYSGSGHIRDQDKGKPAMVIAETGIPTVIVSDVEGPPAPFPVLNEAMFNVPSKSGYNHHLFHLFDAPKVTVSSAPGYSYNHIQNDGRVTSYPGPGHVSEHEEEKTAMVITKPGRPTVIVTDIEGRPAPFPVFNEAMDKVPPKSEYSYNHVRNDGTITTYSGSAHVLEQSGRKPSVFITEPGRPTAVVPDVEGPSVPIPVFNAPMVTVSSGPGYSYNHIHSGQPLPLPTFLTNRIENAAPIAMASRPPTDFYGPSTQITNEHSEIVDKNPDFVNLSEQNHYEDSHYQNIKEQKKNQSESHKNQQPQPNSNVPSGFSYQTVHQDGSVTSYSDSARVESAHVVHDRPLLYPTGPASTSGNISTEHYNETVKCKDPSHAVEVNTKSNSSNFSYTMVNKGATSSIYSGSVKEQHHQVNIAAHEHTGVKANPPVLVTQTEGDNPQHVRITPVLSHYMYKQINHHRPNELTIVNVGEVPVDGQVNVKIAAPTDTGISPLDNVKEVDEIPKDYVFVPPSMYNDFLLPSVKVVEVIPSSTEKSPVAVTSTSTKVSHSFKTRRRHKVSTPTSVSPSKVKTSAPLTTTPSVSSSTEVTSSEGSLSANPIVVLPEENVFSFKQDRADGSSITVIGNKENQVSVIEEQKTTASRGDIPDSSY